MKNNYSNLHENLEVQISLADFKLATKKKNSNISSCGYIVLYTKLEKKTFPTY